MVNYRIDKYVMYEADSGNGSNGSSNRFLEAIKYHGRIGRVDGLPRERDYSEPVQIYDHLHDIAMKALDLSKRDD